MVHIIRRSMKGPDKLLVRESSKWGSRECSTSDNFVSHHLQTVEDSDGVGGELHSPVLLISHIRTSRTFLTKDPELCQWQSVNKTTSGHEGLSNYEVGHDDGDADMTGPRVRLLDMQSHRILGLRSPSSPGWMVRTKRLTLTGGHRNFLQTLIVFHLLTGQKLHVSGDFCSEVN